MSKILLNSIAATLLATSAGVSAKEIVKYQIQFLGADFVYNHSETYEEMGVVDQENINNGYQGIPNNPNFIPTNEAILGNLNKPIIDEDRDYIVLRDPVMNDGKGGASNNKGDSSFGDTAFADQLDALSLIAFYDDGSKETLEVLSSATQTMYVDFRMVLEEKIVDGVAKDYAIVEPYSYFDLLTNDGDGITEADWGLALDAQNDANSTIGVSASGEVEVSLTIRGELFEDPKFDTNNLPFMDLMEIDPNSTIEFSVIFDVDDGLDASELGENSEWQFVTGSGTGNITIADKDAEPVSEPATLGVFGLTLAGMGILQRKRRKKQ